MPHEVTAIPGRIIRIRLKPPLSPETPSLVVPRVLELSKGWTRRPLLIDIRAMESFPKKTAKSFADEFQSHDDSTPTRVAHIGAGAATRLLAGFFLSLIPSEREAKFFTSEKEALTWLREEDWGS